MKAYLLNEVWIGSGRTATKARVAISNQWIDQLRWQRLEAFKKLAEMLLGHLQGILNYCRVSGDSESLKRLTPTS